MTVSLAKAPVGLLYTQRIGAAYDAADALQPLLEAAWSAGRADEAAELEAQQHAYWDEVDRLARQQYQLRKSLIARDVTLNGHRARVLGLPDDSFPRVYSAELRLSAEWSWYSLEHVIVEHDGAFSYC